MKIIIVKDYLYEGNHIMGIPYYDDFDGKNKEKEYYILDDGDIYDIGSLEQDYTIIKTDSEEVIKKFEEMLK